MFKQKRSKPCKSCPLSQIEKAVHIPPGPGLVIVFTESDKPVSREVMEGFDKMMQDLVGCHGVILGPGFNGSVVKVSSKDF